MPITHATSLVSMPRSQNANDADLVRSRDGSSVTIRLAAAQDEPALWSFLSQLSPQARRLRFFTGAADIAYAARLSSLIDAKHCGLVAHDREGVLVGHAIYALLDETRAEVAVEIADHLHGRGLGTILIERLAAVAEARGITHFIAEVLPENRAMLDVVRDGFAAHLTVRDGTDTVEFATASWRLARERFGLDSQPGAGDDERLSRIGESFS